MRSSQRECSSASLADRTPNEHVGRLVVGRVEERRALHAGVNDVVADILVPPRRHVIQPRVERLGPVCLDRRFGACCRASGGLSSYDCGSCEDA